MMKYIKNFEDFVNESVNNNDVVIIVKTRSSKKYKYTRSEIMNFIDDMNLSADDLPSWLYSYYITLDSRSRHPHKTSKYAKQNVEDKLNDLTKHKGKPEELDFNI